MPSLPIFSAAAARTVGLTRGQLRGPGYARLAHDLFIRLDEAIDLRERLQVIATVLPPDAAFSHGTAATLLGAPADAPRRHHVVLTPRRVLPQRAELVVHSRLMHPEDVVVHDGLRLTSGPQTFLDLSAALPSAELVVVGDGLMRAGHLSPSALEQRLERARCVRGVVQARECAPPLSAKSHSRPESLMRYWLLASGLPGPEPQVEILDRRGRVVAHGDLGYRSWKVALEYEGQQHTEADQFGRDIDRYSLMAADGWLVLRFARRHLRGPWTVVERTRSALRTRGCQC